MWQKQNFTDISNHDAKKRRRKRINLKHNLNTEPEKLFDEKHIRKLTKSLDNYFISPTVATVETDQSLKLALDSKIINEAILKNKYQKPNIDKLIETKSQQINDPASQSTTYF